MCIWTLLTQPPAPPLPTVVCLQTSNDKWSFPYEQSWSGADNKGVTMLDHPDSVCVLFTVYVCVCMHVCLRSNPGVQKDDPAVD